MVIEFFDNLEMRVCLRINSLSRHDAVRRFFARVSKLGDHPAWVATGFVVMFTQGPGAGWFLLQALLTAGIGVFVYKLLKQTLVRERPYVANGAIVLGEAPLDRYSFPSGHTLHAVSFSILYGNYEPVLLWLLVPFALLVAASRIILGLHYPSDVIVGAAIGALLAISSLSVFA